MAPNVNVWSFAAQHLHVRCDDYNRCAFWCEGLWAKHLLWNELLMWEMGLLLRNVVCDVWLMDRVILKVRL